MEPKDRIIVALDVDQASKAVELAEKLAPHVGAFKLGFEFMQATLARLKTLSWEESLRELQAYRRLLDIVSGKLFWDGKFMDIPNTVAGASRPVASLGVTMFNVHCLGGSKMMRVALDAATETVSPTGTRPLVLGVTILTSLKYADLAQVADVEQLESYEANAHETIKETEVRRYVLRLAKLAKDFGLDGVVASPLEAPFIRELCGPNFEIVTPGIRSSDDPPDDQGRTKTPGEAIKSGASRLVIGRPITKSANPVEAAKRIAEEIAAVL